MQSNRRQSGKGIFKLGSSASKLGSQKSRPSLPTKYLPSALRKKRNDSSSSQKESASQSGDSPLIHDNPIDVMAKYQTMTKKDEPAVGQLINLDTPSGEKP